jgi:hypothetical protein
MPEDTANRDRSAMAWRSQRSEDGSAAERDLGGFPREASSANTFWVEAMVFKDMRGTPN